MRTFFALCLAGFLELGGLLYGATDNMLGDYDIRRWRGEDGLGADIVNAVEQSLDGYLWCVTQDQVLRFDGQRFTPVSRGGLPQGSLEWRGITADRHGALWFFGERGLFKYDGRAWTPMLKGGEEGGPAINSVEEDSRGVVWAASAVELYRFDGGHAVHFPCVVDGERLPIVGMDVAPDGQAFVVAGTADGDRLFRFQDGEFRRESLPEEFAAEAVVQICAGPSGALWVATERHLLRKSNGVWRAVPFPEGQPVGVRTMLERQDGELWVGTVRGLLRWRGGEWSELTTRDGFFPFAVRGLKEDREGGLWVAGTGGLMRLAPNALHVYLSGLRMEKEPCISLLVAGGEWWMGVAGSKPLKGTPGHMVPANLGVYPENTTASALLKARDGSLWIGTHTRNLWHWRGGKMEIVLPKSGVDAPFYAVTSLLQDRAGRIWVGTLGGLARVTRQEMEPVKVGGWYPKDTVNALYEDSEGTIWVGYQTLGLLKLARDGEPVWFRKGEGLPDNMVRTIYRDKSGVLWVGTSGGLVHWAKNRQSVFTVEQGLVDDVIRQIIEDDYGCLWLGTRQGLMQINQQEFTEVEAGAKNTLGLRLFGRRDGMRSEECTSAAPVKTADGKLWFPTSDGLVMVAPKALPKTIETPRVRLEDVRVAGKEVWAANPLRGGPPHPVVLKFPSRARDVEFRFSSVDFFAPERVRFRYRLEGVDDEWSKPDSSRVALVRSLAPGNYRFRVEACSRSGVWSAEDSSLAFTVPALFWQTVWFRAGAGAVALSAVVLMFAWRERQKNRRKVRELEHEQALERERSRIARDIHDEVGAGLTEVALLSELAQGKTEGGARNYLDDIFQTARDLTRSLDEIVWSINPANDSLEKLISYLVEFARDFLGTASLPCRLQVPTVVPPITVDSTLRHQICLAVKETLNNIVKHAEASEVHMEIAWKASVLRIRIRDNGRGFAREEIKDPAATRDGLENLTARMREIGGGCEQRSGIGEGTCTTLSVEIPTATGAGEGG